MDNSSRYEAPRAPVRPDRAEAADQRRSNGATSGRAVPRNESGGRSAGSPGATNASSGSDGGRSGDRSSTAVPTYSRPRDDRNVTGRAVPRTGPVPDGDHNHGYYPYYPGYIYDPYYSFYYDPFYNSRYGYWAPYGYGYGLGYFSYDPFLFGAMGFPGYYGGYDPSYYGGGTAGGGSSTGSSSSQVYPGSGSIRLKIKPRNAEVFIDGLSVGVIDSFDGVFQRLDVQAGPHKIELRAEGYQTETFDVIVTAGETVTYKGDMKRR
jgi:PEGA domain